MTERTALFEPEETESATRYAPGVDGEISGRVVQRWDDLRPEKRARVEELYRRKDQRLPCNHGTGGPACHCEPDETGQMVGPPHPDCPICYEWRSYFT